MGNKKEIKQRILIVDDKEHSPDRFGVSAVYAYFQEFKKKFFWSKEAWHNVHGIGTGNLDTIKQIVLQWRIPAPVTDVWTPDTPKNRELEALNFAKPPIEVINESKVFQAYIDNSTLNCGVVKTKNDFYFISNRKIEKGDWIVDKKNKQIRQSDCNGYWSNKEFRIEATTDSTLGLYGIEKSFIDKYDYEKGNIKSVELKIENPTLFGENKIATNPALVEEFLGEEFSERAGREVIVVSTVPKKKQPFTHDDIIEELISIIEHPEKTNDEWKATLIENAKQKISKVFPSDVFIEKMRKKKHLNESTKAYFERMRKEKQQ